MGWFDSLFGKKRQSLDDLPPIYGGDGKSAGGAAVINCASMSMANSLIDRYISERHGEKGSDWERGMELSLRHPENPSASIRAISVSLTGGSETMYYFDLARPVAVAKKMVEMGLLSGQQSSQPNKVGSKIIAHILDPKRGYLTQELQVGEDIDADLVARLGYNGNLYVIVTYEAGKPTRTVIKKAIWDQAREQFG